LTARHFIPFLALFLFLLTVSQKDLKAQVPAFGKRVRQQVVVDSVLISGNKRTQASLIASLLEFARGDTLYLDRLLLSMESSRFHLYRSRLFSFVGVTLLYYRAGHTAVKISVKEKPLISASALLQLADRNVSEWWKLHHFSLRRITAGAGIFANNPFGGGEQFSAYFETGFNQAGNVHFILPYLSSDYKWGVEVKAALSRQRIFGLKYINNRLEYIETDNFSLREKVYLLSLIYRPSAEYLISTSLSLHNTRANDEVLAENPFFFGRHSELRYLKGVLKFQMNQSNHFRYPLNGSELSISLAQSGLALLSDVNLTELRIKAGLYQKWFPDWYTKHVMKIRISKGEEENFFLQRAYGFGQEFVRGYELSVIRGQHYLISNNEIKWHAMGIDFLPPRSVSRFFNNLLLDVYLKILVDGGVVTNASDDLSDPLANKALFGSGIGIDLVLFNEYAFSVAYTVNSMLQKGIYLHLNW